MKNPDKGIFPFQADADPQKGQVLARLSG